MCILLTTVTWAQALDRAVKPHWRFARAIHIDPPERHPQPLPLGKSAFKSTLCQPPTPQPSEKVAFKKLFRQCVNLFLRSQLLFSFLPSFLSHFPGISSQVLDSPSPTTKSPPVGHRGRSGSIMSWGKPRDRMHCSRSLSCIIFLSSLPKSHQPARDALTFFFSLHEKKNLLDFQNV